MLAGAQVGVEGADGGIFRQQAEVALQIDAAQRPPLRRWQAVSQVGRVQPPGLASGPFHADGRLAGRRRRQAAVENPQLDHAVGGGGPHHDARVQEAGAEVGAVDELHQGQRMADAAARARDAVERELAAHPGLVEQLAGLVLQPQACPVLGRRTPGGRREGRPRCAFHGHTDLNNRPAAVRRQGHGRDSRARGRGRRWLGIGRARQRRGVGAGPVLCEQQAGDGAAQQQRGGEGHGGPAHMQAPTTPGAGETRSGDGSKAGSRT